MAYIQGVGRGQGTLFPVTLEELIPADHVCRVIDVFVQKLEMGRIGFLRAEAADTGRPPYDPRDLLRLYLYGYLHQIRSSRRLEHECKRNIEVMWLLGRLAPDHKSIAEFRRMHRDAVTLAGAELIRLARSVGLVRGEWVAIDGSKFRAVSSSESVHERKQLERYLERMEEADAEEEVEIDSSAVASALEKLRQHPEPEARFMRTRQGKVPAYNVQIAADSEHALIVAQTVNTDTTDHRSLVPMVEAAKEAVGEPGCLHVVADTGYSSGEQLEQCDAIGVVPHVPTNRTSNRQGDGNLFDRSQFVYDKDTDLFRCPAGQSLKRRGFQRDRKRVIYQASRQVCGQCPLKSQCTITRRRTVYRFLHEEALQRSQQNATVEAMRLRRSTVEYPFALLKYGIFGHPRFLLRGLRGAQTEISLAVAAYNLKRMINVVGGARLIAHFESA
ncbi:MAG TPA: IS1182 family transposase [Gaiellaceae bacterium]|nr:IS1182 family transposase [Gaiellaceae bacterium]